MTNAKRDENNVHTMIAALDSDGTTIKNVVVDVTIHGLKVEDSSTGTGFGVVNAIRDENGVPVLMGVSSTTATVDGIDYVEGVTPVTIYVNSAGSLLIDSN